MNHERFTLGNLPKLDFGKIEAAFDHELQRLVRDCEDRPLDDKAREINLKVKLTPKADANGQHVVCESVDVECEVAGKIPVRRTKIYSMTPRQDGSLVFHPDLPDDPDGSTLYDPDEKRAAV